MKITLQGQEYDFRLTGTVGLVYMAERILGCSFDGTDRYHNLVLYYCCLVASNKNREIPDVMEFVSSLTSASLNAIAAYFNEEWARLEGAQPEHKEAAQGEG